MPKRSFGSRALIGCSRPHADGPSIIAALSEGVDDANDRLTRLSEHLEFVGARSTAAGKSGSDRRPLEHCNHLQGRQVRLLHHDAFSLGPRGHLRTESRWSVAASRLEQWKLERSKAYTVRLAVGSHSVDAKALAETKGVTIAFADRSFNERLRTASMLDVRAEGATLHVPLDKSSLALDRLESCFEKNGREGIEANPFVAPNRKP
jgi:hypothetical protein